MRVSRINSTPVLFNRCWVCWFESWPTEC